MPVVGAGQLELLGVRLKAAGAVGLRRQLLAGIRAGAAPLVGDVREAARSILPKSGGLNNWVADSNIRVATRLSGRNVGVRIINSRSGSGSGGTADFGSDKGVVRHPVFGHAGRWSTTKVTPGWFSHTLEEKVSSVTPFVVAACESVAVALTRPL